MTIYALGDKFPTIDPSAFVHPQATIIGDVTIGAESSVWPHAVLRGDASRIVVGARTSIQDGAVIHCTGENETRIGDDCVIGHLVHMEGCTIEDCCLVGTADGDRGIGCRNISTVRFDLRDAHVFHRASYRFVIDGSAHNS